MVDPLIFIIITILGVGLGVKLTTTQNPVYSGLYLVLLFFLGSAISFLLGLEFMALLFLLVYAGAIAVLVLFVVMMLDVKAIDNPWSAGKKRLAYSSLLVLLCALLALVSSEELLGLMKKWSTICISSLVPFSLISYEDDLKKRFFPEIMREIVIANFDSIQESMKRKQGESNSSNKEIRKDFEELMDERLRIWDQLCNSEGLADFLRLCFHKESIEGSYGVNNMWFVEFDSSCALNDPSYLLYSTHAILLIIAGIVLLIAMVGAISLTLQKNCPESLYRQLGRESSNAVFGVKEEDPLNQSFTSRGLQAIPE